MYDPPGVPGVVQLNMGDVGTVGFPEYVLYIIYVYKYKEYYVLSVKELNAGDGYDPKEKYFGSKWVL